MNNVLSRIDAALPARDGGRLGFISDFYELSKPRIITLLLITTAAAMVIAARGIPSLRVLL
ncbi:MAG: protoheme IX farnesyltransferase, partial [Candidatus Eremiobacteraeota bacterium]|nr:protoheme IX farnesyltransferase [Candidatus Eremiobacteraeota bacterium]